MSSQGSIVLPYDLVGVLGAAPVVGGVPLPMAAFGGCTPVGDTLCCVLVLDATAAAPAAGAAEATAAAGAAEAAATATASAAERAGATEGLPAVARTVAAGPAAAPSAGRAVPSCEGGAEGVMSGWAASWRFTCAGAAAAEAWLEAVPGFIAPLRLRRGACECNIGPVTPGVLSTLSTLSTPWSHSTPRLRGVGFSSQPHGRNRWSAMK
jgi:hypothetical protein